MRPTGKLHLGHLVGALKNWVKLQDEYDCVYCVADWHALMGEYENSQVLTQHMHDMILDWLACGIDPKRSIIFIQSQVFQHLELQMILSCITPLGWLERNPTYKEQLREIKTRDLQTYGFLGYPVLQAADILLYKAQAVPIGEDQLPHIELTREIARRFNHIFKCEVLPDCEAILTPTSRLLGIDGRKMSKSYQNTVDLSAPQEEIEKKIKNMFTDPKRIRKTDSGHPDKCNVYSYYDVFAPPMCADVRAWCTGAQKGCTECKKILAEKILEALAPIREKRKGLEKDKDIVKKIIATGKDKACAIAEKTMTDVKQVVFNHEL